MAESFPGSPKTPSAKIENLVLFGQLLIRYRANRTRQELADLIGVSAPVIYNWEDAHSFPREEILPKIAEAYKIELNELKEAYNASIAAREVEKKYKKKPKRVINPDW